MPWGCHASGQHVQKSYPFSPPNVAKLSTFHKHTLRFKVYGKVTDAGRCGASLEPSTSAGAGALSLATAGCGGAQHLQGLLQVTHRSADG